MREDSPDPTARPGRDGPRPADPGPLGWALAQLAEVRPPSPAAIRARYRVAPERAAVEIEGAWGRYRAAARGVHARGWELADAGRIEDARTIGAPAMNPHLSRLMRALERATEAYDQCVSRERDRGRRLRALRITERRGFTALRCYYRHKAPNPGASPAARPRQRRAAPARGGGSRRAGASSSSSSADPGDGESDPEPPPPPRPRLTLAPTPRAILTFGCLTAEERGAQVEPVVEP